MPDAVAVDIAKKVVTFLQGESFSVAISPERSYADWEMELKDAGTLHVDVVAVTTEQKIQLATRGKSRFEVPIDIAIRQKFDVDNQDEDTGRLKLAAVDALMYLTEEVYAAMTQHRLSDALSSIWQETKILVAPEREALRTRRQFTSVVRIHFEGYKPI